MAKFNRGMSMLRDAGAAGVKHVHFVSRAKRLPPDELGPEFSRYVQGLSGAAFRGFKLTLLAMAKRKSDDPATSAFLQSLYDAADNARSGSVSVTPTGRHELASVESDGELLASWADLSESRWRPALHAHLDRLPAEGQAAFLGSVTQISQQVAATIEDHKANENQAWGGFAEDRMSYMMASLKTGARDPGWLATLRRLQELEAFLQAVRVATHERAFHLPAPPLVEEHEEKERGEAPRSAGEAFAAGPDAAALNAELDKQLREGTVSPEREAYYRTLIEQLEPLRNKLGDPATSLGDKTALLSRLRSLGGQFHQAFADPGGADRVTGAGAGFRAATIDRYVQAMKSHLYVDLLESPGKHTAEAAAQIIKGLNTVQRSLEHATDDGGVVLEERNLLRTTAADFRQYVHREHLMVARPVWETSDYVPSPNSVFYSGRPDLNRSVEEACSPLLLTVHNNSRVEHHGQVRWDDLNSCAVGVYDLRGWHPGLAGDEAVALATVAYELGLAFSVGRPTVIVAGEDDDLPFDIDLSACLLTGDPAADRQALQEALDGALYGSPPTSDASSLAATRQYLDRFTAGHAMRSRFEGATYLAPEWLADPAGFEGVVQQMLRQMPESGLRLLRPRWPGCYPDGDGRRAFHVMPFGRPWSDAVRDATRAACDGLAGYHRGDEADDGRIIRAIWMDICRADVVLVDVTDLNLNVMIELGLAHALGRRTVLLRRTGANKLPRNIAKLRVYDYADPDDMAEAVLPKRLSAALR